MKEKMSMNSTIENTCNDGLSDYIDSPRGKRTIRTFENAVVFTQRKGGFDTTRVDFYYIMTALFNKGLVFEAFNYIFSYGYKRGYERAIKELKGECKAPSIKRNADFFTHGLINNDIIRK